MGEDTWMYSCLDKTWEDLEVSGCICKLKNGCWDECLNYSPEACGALREERLILTLCPDYDQSKQSSWFRGRRLLALGRLRASHTRAWKVWLAGQKSDNDSWFPGTVYKITREAMSVFLGFLEATVRRDVTSTGTASCERRASTESMTAWG